MTERRGPEPGETRITGMRIDRNAADEAENFYLCETCGQAVDMRDLVQVLHHEEPDHEPMENDA